MPIPNYQQTKLPLLAFAGDKQVHTLKEAVEHIANLLRLTQDERDQLLPSGKQATFANRVYWSRTYLTKALLLEKVGAGKFRITERGLSVLSQNPSKIDNAFLMQFPEFVTFYKGASSSGQNGSIANNSPLVALDATQTPEETLEQSYQTLTQTLVSELLDRIKENKPVFFERLVVDLLIAMGYGGANKEAGMVTPLSNDGGIDGIIFEDKLGLDIVCLQAKRWENTVYDPNIKQFVGSVLERGATKGVFITTSSFSEGAKQYAKNISQARIVLIDGQQLASLMIQYGVGVSTVATYAVKRVDSDYFEEPE